MAEKSDFGEGCTYCIALFLAHQERYFNERNEMEKAGIPFGGGMWFNAAADHLFGLQIPKQFPSNLRQRLKKFQDKVILWGSILDSPGATEQDIKWALREAKDLLILIDKQLGIKAIRGSWE